MDRRIPTRIHQLSALDAVASLKSSAGGLAHTEAARRLQEFGRNAVQAIDRETLSLRLIKEFTTFFSLILWVAAGLAFFAEWSDPGQEKWPRKFEQRDKWKLWV